MSLSKLIDTNILAYYDSKKDAREDYKIAHAAISDKTTLISEYFKESRDGQIYGVKFAYNSSAVIQPAGTKYAANALLSMSASTRDIPGLDDYSDKCLFRHLDANVHQDNNGDLIIDYIEGEDGFSYTGKVNVVCLFAPVYEKIYTGAESSTNYIYIEWCDTPRDGFTLNPLCKDSHGNNRGFIAIAKYPAGLIDGELYSSAGIIPWCNGPSYEACVDAYHAINNYQCALTMAQYTYIQRLFMMKYASTNFNSKLGGIINYNYMRQITIPTNNHDYIVVQSPGDLYVGTSWDIRNGSSRQSDLVDIVEIVSKDTSFGTFTDINSKLTISDPSYTITSDTFTLLCKNDNGTAVSPYGDIDITFELNGSPVTVDFVYTNTRYLEVYDNGTRIATTSSAATTTNAVVYVSKNVTTTTSCYAFSSIYKNGYSMGVLGNDGCYMPGTFSATPRFPSVLSGIELFDGASEVLGNVVMEYDSGGHPHVLVCNNPSNITKNVADIDATYTDAGYFNATTTGNNLKYSSDISYDLTLATYTTTCGPGSSTTGLCDSIYYNATKTSGKVAVEVFGDMTRTDHAGLFFLNASSLNMNSVSAYMASRPAFITKF
jgi:hypothetical protein